MQPKRPYAVWTLEDTGQRLLFLALVHDSSALFLSKTHCSGNPSQQGTEELNREPRYRMRICSVECRGTWGFDTMLPASKG